MLPRLWNVSQDKEKGMSEARSSGAKREKQSGGKQSGGGEERVVVDETKTDKKEE